MYQLSITGQTCSKQDVQLEGLPLNHHRLVACSDPEGNIKMMHDITRD